LTPGSYNSPRPSNVLPSQRPRRFFHSTDLLPTVPLEDPLDHARYVMQKIYGYSQLREHQKEVLSCFLQGSDTLAILPTGGGKSMCYVLPAMMGQGLGVVVSPLIALIRDQVIQLRGAGVPAASLDSMQSVEQKSQVVHALKKGWVKLLYISPERLARPLFQSFLVSLQVRFIAVDEAHCASEWGADFRPEYRKLGEYFAKLPASIPRLALTATATQKVRRDIIEFLDLRSPKEIIKTPIRDNLVIGTQELRRKSNHAAKILASLQKKKRSLSDNQGIIYTFSRKKTEKLAAHLADCSVVAAAYHGGMSGQDRDRVQKAFLQGELSVVVATNAFGLGINKKDIRFVHHYGLPTSLESYMQQIGRAGRDGNQAECTLFFTYGDYASHKFLLEKNYPSVERLTVMYSSLVELTEAGKKMVLCEWRSHLSSVFSEQEFSRCLEILHKEGVIRCLVNGSSYGSQGIYGCWPDEAEICLDSRGHMDNVLALYPKWKQEAMRRLQVMMQYAEAGKRRDEVVRRYFVSS